MNSELILQAGGAATAACVIFDLIIDAIQSWQRKRAGVVDIRTFGIFGRLLISLVINFILCTGFTYGYALTGAGSGNAYLYGAVIWLIVAIPMLATSKYQDDIQRMVLGTRILGWLFKIGAASASAHLLIG